MNARQSSTQPSWRQRLQVLDAFEQAWERGDSPRVESFLPASQSNRPFLLVNLVLVELEYRLRAGQSVRAEEFFERFPELLDKPENVLEVILAERRQRQHLGQEPKSDEYLQRFPQYQVELARQLEEGPTSLALGWLAPGAGRTVGDDLPERIGRYRIDQEIARGGMGKVMRIYDEDFQRPLAMKVLLDFEPWHAEQVERFLREARLTAQLQHPGIPPVQEMGRLPDGRPYFIMKLIKGKSLAALLRERVSGGHDLPRFLSIFEQVCQTLAYAHDRHVIHRDIKPGNVMVGAFGEVQVMDWGLAKVLDAREQRHPGHVEPAKPIGDHSVPPSSTDEGKTAAGAILGTPAYMAPEQARGEIENLDPRADVFGAGGILCEVLTGKSPFAADSAVEAHRLAMKGDLSAAFARLDACGADLELIQVARRCLAPEAQDRYADAGAVAEAIARYQAHLQARLKKAEIDQAAAEVKASEERKRRRVWLALTASVLVLALVAGGGWLWYQQDRAARAAEELVREAEALRKRTLAIKAASEALEQGQMSRHQLRAELLRPGGVVALVNDPARWRARIDAARAALDRARALQPDADPSRQERLTNQIRDLAAGINQDDDDRELTFRLETIRLDRAVQVSGEAFDSAMARRDYELAFANAGMSPSPGKEQATAKLIKESPIKEQLLAAVDDWAYLAGQRKDEHNLRDRLLQIARLADPDPWRDSVRNAGIWGNSAALKTLADRALADRSAFARLTPQILFVFSRQLLRVGMDEAWLRQALLQHPSDFWLNFQMGSALIPTKPTAAAGYLRAALAIRKDNATAWYNLGNALRAQNDLSAAVEAYKKAIAFRPNLAIAWTALANASKHDPAVALAAYHKATALDPTLVVAWYNLAVLLHNRKDLPGAIKAYEKIVHELKKNHALSWNGLGNALRLQDDWPAASAAFENAVKAEPKLVNAWLGLGLCKYRANDLVAAIKAYKKAVALDPENASGWYNLGVIHALQKDVPAAVAAYRNAVASQPDHADAQRELVRSCRALGRFDEAVAAGKQALAALPENHSQRATIARQLAECQKLLATEQWLARVLGGAKASAIEKIVLAEFCLRDKSDFLQAVRLYQAAFAEQPKLTDVSRGYRYHAARAAALAAGGLDSSEPTRLRQQALDWLRADLADWSNLVDAANPGDIFRAAFWLRAWPSEASFANVQSPAIDKLPGPERTAWNQFWSDVDRVMKAARSQFTQTQRSGSLSSAQPEQVHDLMLRSGRTYQFQLESRDFDAYLRLVDADGNMLMENDNIDRNNRNARLTFTPKETAAYQLIATSFQQRGTGAYTLFILECAAKKSAQ